MKASRTGRPTASAAPAVSGSISPNFPPNPPPTAIGTMRTRSCGRPSVCATTVRVRKMPCVLAWITTPPSPSGAAVQVCGSR